MPGREITECLGVKSSQWENIGAAKDPSWPCSRTKCTWCTVPIGIQANSGKRSTTATVGALMSALRVKAPQRHPRSRATQIRNALPKTTSTPRTPLHDSYASTAAGVNRGYAAVAPELASALGPARGTSPPNQFLQRRLHIRLPHQRFPHQHRIGPSALHPIEIITVEQT